MRLLGQPATMVFGHTPLHVVLRVVGTGPPESRLQGACIQLIPTLSSLPLSLSATDSFLHAGQRMLMACSALICKSA